MSAVAEPLARLPYAEGVGTVFRMEILQRMRSRGWYIVLGVWFVVILGLTAAVGAAMNAGTGTGSTDDASAGQVSFELVASFVLLFGSLVAPALAANSVAGDRAGGTLAVLQASLLTPGQILWGKWLAAWVVSLAFLVAAAPAMGLAAIDGLSDPTSFWLMIPLMALEMGIMCGIGVGISAVTTRPLFAILSTYLVVAFLGLGTLIAVGLAAVMITEDVRSSQFDYSPQVQRELQDWDGEGADPSDNAPQVCGASVYVDQQPATERFTWLLAANPFVVVADAAAKPATVWIANEGGYRYLQTSQVGVMGSIATAVRQMQAGPQAKVYCLAGQEIDPVSPSSQPPVWPLGLAVQAIITAGVVGWGRHKLMTPAGKLTAGTRVA